MEYKGYLWDEIKQIKTKTVLKIPHQIIKKYIITYRCSLIPDEPVMIIDLRAIWNII